MMKRVSCIVVEDEPLARDILLKFITEVKGLDLVSMFENAGDAISFLQNQRVELMFLDVNLPDLSGIDMFRSLNNPPKVIFATAHHEFAVDGFELNAVDYLLKPFSFQRFLKAVNKAFEQINFGNTAGSGTKVNLKSGKTIYSLERDKILFVEGCGDYVNVKTDDNQFTIHATLKEMERILAIHGCLRVHRSFIVNINRIDIMSGKMLTIGDKSIPVGSNYQEELDKRLKINLDESQS